MKHGLRLVIPFLFLLGPAPAEDANKIYLAANQTAELLAKEGQRVVVYGETEGSAKSASGTNLVNFKGSDFFLVTFKSDLGPFKESEPHLAYENKRIAVEGVIALYRGKPQIKLTDPAQVIVLAPDAVFPPPVAKKEESVTSAAEEKKMTPANTRAAPTAPEAVRPKPPVDPSEYFKK